MIPRSVSTKNTQIRIRSKYPYPDPTKIPISESDQNPQICIRPKYPYPNLTKIPRSVSDHNLIQIPKSESDQNPQIRVRPKFDPNTHIRIRPKFPNPNLTKIHWSVSDQISIQIPKPDPDPQRTQEWQSLIIIYVITRVSSTQTILLGKRAGHDTVCPRGLVHSCMPIVLRKMDKNSWPSMYLLFLEQRSSRILMTCFFRPVWQCLISLTHLFTSKQVKIDITSSNSELESILSRNQEIYYNKNSYFCMIRVINVKNVILGLTLTLSGPAFFCTIRMGGGGEGKNFM